MAKKVKKKSITKSKKPIIRSSSEIKVEKVLVENFIALQKVMTNLSVKFDNLSNQISKLLELFEISAKALAEKEFDLEKGSMNTEKISKQMGTLLEQNKIIARGMTLMNDKILEQNPQMQNIPPRQIQGMPQNISGIPQPPRPISARTQEQNINQYQKSISSRYPKSNNL